MGLGTVDEGTGPENDRFIVGSAHIGRGAMNGFHALVMARLLSDGSNGCIKMRGCGYGHRRWHWHDVDDTIRTVGRGEIRGSSRVVRLALVVLRDVRMSGSGSCCERGPIATPGSERAAGSSPRLRAARRESFGRCTYTLAPKGMEANTG